ncbi:MAG: hypothetical protein WCI71_12035, partial [Bacteroidota bacterium]
MHIPVMKIILGFLIISGIVPGVEKSYAGQHVDSVYFYKEVRYIDSLNRSMDPERGSHVDTNRTVPQEALDRAVSIHYLKGQIDALKGLASYYSAAGNISKAFEFIFSRLELHLKNNYLPGYVKTHIELSSLFLKLNDTAKAMKYIRLGYKIAQKTCDPEDFGLIYYALGNYFFTKGEYLQAKRNGLLSIACFIKSKNNDWQGMSYRMIGDACQKLGQ